MKIIKIRKTFNTLEKYHAYKFSKNRLHMDDAYTDVYNPIFETLQELNTIYKLYRLHHIVYII
jgi:hypothetical protein